VRRACSLRSLRSEVGDTMYDLLAYEPYVRLGIFSAVFGLLATWELISPRRAQTIGRTQRWPSNLALAVIDAILVRALFPMSAVAVAVLTEAKGWGLLNAWTVPKWLAIPLAIIVLDFVIYLQHVLFHAIPALWRLHRMHHADLEFDVTTGGRFHPIEILLSMIFKLTVVTALGAPPFSVLLFEMLLNATAMFNHSNIHIRVGVDRVLRWLVVTPDMHRVHHSIVVRETNSNFGFNLPWWDRLLGTYRDQPGAGHGAMAIGVLQLRDPSEQRLDRLLTQPFRENNRSYGIGNRSKRPE
jgi:sterol desaturase/sphingolipid hydroxylase (fatty acid hydroxylase superfamily)